MAIFGLALFSIALIFAGAGSILNFLFPLAAFAIGIYLYFRAPILYIGFTWWMWFLTPLVRRLADWQGRYTEPSPLLLAPFLVTAITVVTLWRNLPVFFRRGGIPFILPLVGVVYAIAVGAIFQTPPNVVVRGLDWICPLFYAFHLFVNWRNYPTYRKSLQRIFLWGVLIMGVYGVIQFIIAPPWEVLWLQKSYFLSGSEGRPEEVGAFTINVWSTMSSNRPFATVMMGGLILLLANQSKGKLGLVATFFGYCSFLLSRKRIVWLTWIVALLIYTFSLKSKNQKRTIITIAIIACIISVVANLEPFSSFISSRFASLSNLEGDASANARIWWFNLMIDAALVSFLGRGIGGPSHDNGILASLFNIGWLGIVFYFGGLLIAFINMFWGEKINSDQFACASRSISIAIFLEFPFGLPHVEASGMLLWGSIGVVLAAKKYHQYQRKLKTLEDVENLI